jgi:hypothetical protein
LIWLALYPEVAEAASIKAIPRLSFLRPASSVDVDKIMLAVIYCKKKSESTLTIKDHASLIKLSKLSPLGQGSGHLFGQL